MSYIFGELPSSEFDCSDIIPIGFTGPDQDPVFEPCFICGVLSHTMSISFEAPLHIMCTKRAWDEFAAANLALGPPEPPPAEWSQESDGRGPSPVQ